MAIAPNGEIASFCTIWFDDVNRIGAFEPVGTAPAHQRRGLGKAVIHEGLRRLRALGAVEACVGSESPETFTFYSAIGLISTGFTQAWEVEL